MSKIAVVWSPSQQPWNKCSFGDTEADHMREISKLCHEKLSSDDRFDSVVVPPFSGGEMDKLASVVLFSSNYVDGHAKAIHIDLHSDAGGGHGCSVYWYADSSYGNKCAMAIYKRLCALGQRGREARPWNGLYVLHNTDAPACLIEVAFHDNKIDAEWIHNNMDAIAQCCVDGVYETYGLQKPQNITCMPQLELESEGEAVVYLQNELNGKGFDCGIADGIFGKNTRSAVLQFQEANGLENDGIVGPKTWSKLITK